MWILRDVGGIQPSLLKPHSLLTPKHAHALLTFKSQPTHRRPVASSDNPSPPSTATATSPTPSPTPITPTTVQ
jgi:hypothetical protein